jgi:hypothetical protein
MLKEDTLYYEDGTVSITNTRAVFDTIVIYLEEITFISMAEIPPNNIIAIIGYVFITAGLVGGAIIVSTFTSDVFYIVAAMMTLFFVGAGIFLISIPKPKFALKIHSASEVYDALISTNRKYIKIIVLALSEAIGERGLMTAIQILD